MAGGDSVDGLDDGGTWLLSAWCSSCPLDLPVWVILLRVSNRELMASNHLIDEVLLAHSFIHVS